MEGGGILTASSESWNLAMLGLFSYVYQSLLILFLDTLLVLDYFHYYILPY